MGQRTHCKVCDDEFPTIKQWYTSDKDKREKEEEENNNNLSKEAQEGTMNKLDPVLGAVFHLVLQNVEHSQPEAQKVLKDLMHKLQRHAESVDPPESIPPLGTPSEEFLKLTKAIHAADKEFNRIDNLNSNCVQKMARQKKELADTTKEKAGLEEALSQARASKIAATRAMKNAFPKGKPTPEVVAEKDDEPMLDAISLGSDITLSSCDEPGGDATAMQMAKQAMEQSAKDAAVNAADKAELDAQRHAFLMRQAEQHQQNARQAAEFAAREQAIINKEDERKKHKVVHLKDIRSRKIVRSRKKGVKKSKAATDSKIEGEKTTFAAAIAAVDPVPSPAMGAGPPPDAPDIVLEDASQAADLANGKPHMGNLI